VRNHGGARIQFISRYAGSDRGVANGTKSRDDAWVEGIAESTPLEFEVKHCIKLRHRAIKEVLGQI